MRGVGIDLVELVEIEALAARPAMLARIFTEAELAHCEAPNRLERLAARYAAKEAAFKAAGTGWTGEIAWRDVEVIAGSPPTLNVTGTLAAIVGEARWMVSFSHTPHYAVAIVVLA